MGQIEWREDRVGCGGHGVLGKDIAAEWHGSDCQEKRKANCRESKGLAAEFRVAWVLLKIAAI